jgi:hypothetical protein
MGMSEDDAIGLAFGSVADTILPTGNKFGNVEGQREFLKEMRKQTLLLEATFQVQKEARDKIEEGNDNDRGKPRRGKNTDE